jgi:gliding motility-associated-like protein
MRKIYLGLISLLFSAVLNTVQGQSDICATATQLSAPNLNGSCNNFTWNGSVAGDPFFLGTCGHGGTTPYTWWRFTAAHPYIDIQFNPAYEIALVNFGGPSCNDNGGDMTIITGCGPTLISDQLVVGEEYFLMVTLVGADPGSTCMRVYNPNSIPSNDLCSNAISIGTANLNTQACPGGGSTYTFGTPLQDVVNFNCNAPQVNYNIWFKFTAQGPFAEITGAPGVEFFIFDFNGLTCDFDPDLTDVIGVCGPGEGLETYDLEEGVEYFIMASSTLENLPTSFNVCVFNPVPPPNNDCENVIALLPADLDCNTSGTVYEFGWPTNDVGTVAECGHDQFTPNIWFKFTARGSYARIRGRANFQFFLLEFTGLDCEADGAFLQNPIECNEGEDIEFHDLVLGQEYFILVASMQAAPYPNNVNLCVFNPELPENDEPCDFISLSDGGCHNGSTLSSYPELGGGIPGENCGTTNNLDDVWYRIEMGPRDYGVTINFTNLVGFSEDLIVGIYSYPLGGDCNDLALTGDIPIAADCFFPGNPLEFLHLYPNKEYFIRVTSTSANDHGTFTLCINHIVIPDPCSYSDDCFDVIDMVLDIPFDPFEACNGGTGPPLGFSGCLQTCNIGATPDGPPVTSPCIQPTWRTTWYRFNTQNYPYTDIRINKADIDGIGLMGIDVFDACSGQSVLPGAFGQCVISEEDELLINIPALELQQNTDYYIAVGSTATNTGFFELCVNIYDVPAGPDDLCIDGPPVIVPDAEPPYNPGQTVNFTVTIPPYSQTTTIQWLQAVIPVFGEGWDPSSFEYFSGPPVAHTVPSGIWDWWDEGEITYNYSSTNYQLYINELGQLAICHFSNCPPESDGCISEDDRLPAGWYAYSPGAGPECQNNGNPNFGWGDGSSPSSSLTFTFSLTAREFDGEEGCDPTGFKDLGVEIYTMSDQQTGCWQPASGADACRSDRPGIFVAQNKCCQGPEIEYEDTICSEGNFSWNIVTDQDAADPDIAILWQLQVPAGLEVLSGAISGAGRSLSNTFRNQTGTPLTAIYNILATNSLSCDIESQVFVTILSELDIALPDPPVLCPGEEVVLSPVVSGGTGVGYSYLWTGGSTGSSLTVSPAATTTYRVTVTDNLGCQGIASVTVRVALPFTAQIAQGPDEFCVNDEFPFKQVRARTPTSGEGPFTYTWGGPGFELMDPQTINPLMTGTYTVTITDIYGCEQTASKDLIVHALPIIEIYSDDEFCETDEAFEFDFYAFGASGNNVPVTYIQNQEYINPILSVIDPPFISEYFGTGTFFITLEAIDPNTGCKNTLDYFLTIQGVPDIQFSIDPLCYGTPGAFIDVQPFGGSFSSDVLPPDVLFPDGGIASADLEPGSYEFFYEVQDGACYATDTGFFEITPGVELNLVPGSEVTLDCNNPEVQLGISNQPERSFTWELLGTGIVSTSQYYTTSEPGVYVITFEGFDRCLSRDTIRVFEDKEAPELSVSDPNININCDGETSGEILIIVDGDSDPGNYGYAWTVVSGEGSIVGTNNAAAYEGEGLYRLDVLNPSNGCTGFIEVNVAIDTLAPDLSVEGISIIDCLVELPLDITANSNVNTLVYNWTASNGGSIDPDQNNLSTIAIDQPGTYSVLITNTINNCTTEGEIVIEDIRTEPSLEVISDLMFNCYDQGLDSFVIQTDAGSPSLDIVLSDPAMAQEIVDNTVFFVGSGTITVTIVDEENGCTVTKEYTIEESLDSPAYTQDEDISLDCESGPLASLGISTDAGMDILWSTNNGTILSGQNQSTVNIQGPGVYAFLITNPANGCTSENEIVVSQDTDIPDLNAGEDITIDCLTDLPVSILANSSVNGLIYSWSTTGGQIPAGQENNPEIFVEAAGVYTIQVVNPDNDCATAVSVVVSDIREQPTADFDFDPVFNCFNQNNSNINVNTDVSNPNYQWTLNGNPLQSGNNADQWTLSQGGNYEILITNLDNNCFEIFPVTIVEDLENPEVNAGGDQEIDCTDEGEKILQGSSSTPNVSYEWSTAGGTILTNPNLGTITVGSSGSYTLLVTSLTNGCQAQESILVTTSDDIPVVNAGSDLDFLCSTTSFDLLATSNVGPGAQYTWSASGGGQISGINSGESITVTAPGTYTVEVFNPENGCRNIDQLVVVDRRANPDANAGPDQILACFDEGQKVLAGNSQTTNVSYQWSTTNGVILGNPNQQQITVGQAGVYTLTVIDNFNDCVSTDQVVVVASLNAPLITAPDQLTINCFTQADGISVDASSNVPNANFAWSTAGGGQIGGNPNSNSITALVPGVYTVTVINPENGCLESREVTVLGDFVQPNVDAGLDGTVDCLNETTQLLGSSTNNVTFDWSTQDGVILSNPAMAGITVGSAGIYTLTVVDQNNGCQSTDVAVVVSNDEYPDANAGPDVVLGCEEFGILTIDGTSTTAGVNYRWTTTGGNIIGDSNVATIVIDGVGTYTLQVTNPDNGCISTDSFLATFTTDLPVADAGEDQELTCEVNSVVLSGSATGGNSFTYRWEETQFGTPISNPNLQNIQVNSSGIYQLTVINNENGCSDTDRVRVFAEEDVLSGLILNERDVRCYGEGNGGFSIVEFLGGVSPFQINFNGINVGSSTNFGPLGPGTYSIEVTDSNGCEYDRTVTIIEPDSLGVYIGEDIIIQKGQSVEINPLIFGTNVIVSYDWDTSAIALCPGCTNLTLAPEETVRVTLTIVDENGCVATHSKLIVVERDAHIFVPNVISPNGDGKNDRLVIYAGPEIARFKSLIIFDRWGNFVYENSNFPKNAETIGWDGTLRGKPVQAGVFVYALVAELVDGTEKLVKGDVTVVY